MSSLAPRTAGNINERGYLQGFERRGYSLPRCILELIANSIDAIDKNAFIGDYNKQVLFDIQRTSISLIDNGYGMDMDSAENMFDMHRENHASQSSRGVSGIGAKPATCILSNKTEVNIYTRKQQGDYICIVVPWDIIYKEYKFKSMIIVREMTSEEIAVFISERKKANMLINNEAIGTTTKFIYNDKLYDVIANNFLDISESSLTNPLDRIGCVFGMDNVSISMNHFENGNSVMSMYNYFGGTQAEYYKGYSTDIIQQWSYKNDTRFIWITDCDNKEINQVGKGYSMEPATSKKGTYGYNYDGDYTVKTGLRVDNNIFDAENPLELTAGDSGDDKNPVYNLHHIGKDNSVFLTHNKLIRNNQLIGLIPPEVSIGSARANGDARLKIKLVQCHVEFKPVSNLNNVQDTEMGIQENKNQFNGDALPKTFTRLIKGIKEKKCNEILKWFSSIISKKKDDDARARPHATTTATVTTVTNTKKEGKVRRFAEELFPVQKKEEPVPLEEDTPEEEETPKEETPKEETPEEEETPKEETPKEETPEEETPEEETPEEETPEEETPEEEAPEEEETPEKETQKAPALEFKTDNLQVKVYEGSTLLYTISALDIKTYLENVNTKYGAEDAKRVSKVMSETS